MKKYFIIFGLLILIMTILTPLNTKALNMEILKKECNPLVQLNVQGTEYYCTKTNKVIKINQKAPTDPFGNPNTPTEASSLKELKDTNVCKNTGECFKGVGLMFQLIYYNGSGEPIPVGNKYHVYNPELLADQTITTSASIPQTSYDFRDPNKNFNISQRLSPADNGELFTALDNNWTERDNVNLTVHQDGSAYKDGKGVEHEALPPNKYLGTRDYFYMTHFLGGPEMEKKLKIITHINMIMKMQKLLLILMFCYMIPKQLENVVKQVMIDIYSLILHNIQKQYIPKQRY